MYTKLLIPIYCVQAMKFGLEVIHNLSVDKLS